MKFKNTLMGLFLLASGSLGADTTPCTYPTPCSYTMPCLDATVYERSIVVSKQNYPSLPAAVTLDKKHKAMRDSKVFTDAEVDQLDIDFMNDLLVQYGIDFSTIAPDPATGERTYPGVGVMQPVVYGNSDDQPWIVVRDTINPKREFRFRQKEYKTIVTFTADFYASSGTQVGAHITPGSIFFRGYIVQGKIDKKWKNPKNREVFEDNCTQLTAQTLNMWGKEASAITSTTIDKYGNIGFGLSTTLQVNIPADATGVTHTEGRIVYTWDKLAACDDHCHE